MCASGWAAERQNWECELCKWTVDQNRLQWSWHGWLHGWAARSKSGIGWGRDAVIVTKWGWVGRRKGMVWTRPAWIRGWCENTMGWRGAGVCRRGMGWRARVEINLAVIWIVLNGEYRAEKAWPIRLFLQSECSLQEAGGVVQVRRGNKRCVDMYGKWSCCVKKRAGVEEK